jgi:phage regulator Rha-like protein
MRVIITLNKKEPVIDTLDMAIGFDMQHRSIMRLVKIHERSIKKFGKVRFEITPSEKGQNQKHAYLNEAQATFVGTLMNNKGRAIEFKIQLVEEFDKMKRFIENQHITRSVGKEIRKSLTDSVRDSGENERMHGKGYSNYTRMIYDITGLKDQHIVWKDLVNKNTHGLKNFRDWIYPEELKRVELAESFIKPLLELDKQYSEIKETLKPLFEKKELKGENNKCQK